MHFTYSESIDDDLMQGDIIERSPYIEAVLEKYHPHFFNNKKNLFFIVLTQSCDLARRGTATCPLPYITLGAVRPLDLVLEQKTKELSASGLPIDFPLFTSRSKNQYSQFLHRLFNNNENDMFYLHREPSTKLAVDCCAQLRLSVPIKNEHYDECLKARILSLKEEFRALLGWKFGHIYSRVGTQDWPSEHMDQMVSGIIKESVIDIDEKTFKKIKKRVKSWGEENLGAAMSQEELASIIKTLPKKKDEVAERVRSILSSSEELSGAITDPTQLTRFINSISRKIKMDSEITSILK